MRVFYFQHNGKTHLICVRGSSVTRKSPIHENCNTCIWIVPGTVTEEE